MGDRIEHDRSGPGTWVPLRQITYLICLGPQRSPVHTLDAINDALCKDVLTYSLQSASSRGWWLPPIRIETIGYAYEKAFRPRSSP